LDRAAVGRWTSGRFVVGRWTGGSGGGRAEAAVAAAARMAVAESTERLKRRFVVVPVSIDLPILPVSAFVQTSRGHREVGGRPGPVQPDCRIEL